MSASNVTAGLNLPKTSFPIRASLPQREPATVQRWLDDPHCAKLHTPSSSPNRFVLHDGPPYANGQIHLGHALNKVLKDIILKSKRLSGFHAPYIPGWDCHGLAIELQVENKLSKKEMLDSQVFREKCRHYANEQIALQKSCFQRLGVLAKWDQPYLSMDKRVQSNTLRLLGKVIENGHLKRKLYPVYWCPKCQSALAEAELEYADIDSQSAYVTFPMQDLSALSSQTGCTLSGIQKVSTLIWTTMIWTLPVSQGVAVHPEMVYYLLTCTDQPTEAIWVAQACLERLEQMTGKRYTVQHQLMGHQLVGLSVEHPWLKTTLPIVGAQHVTAEAGSGLVHLAAAHGPEDFAIAQSHGWTVNTHVDESGRFNVNQPLVGGAFCFDTTEVILNALKSQNNWLIDHRYRHSYPHCWRHKVPILYRATAQWFITMDDHQLRERALSLIDQVDWSPAWAKERMRQLLLHRPDWCISRQRRWGVPLALWIHKTTQQLHPQMTLLLDELANRVEHEGLDAWWNPTTAMDERTANYQKVTDVLDVWFDSGATFFSVVHARPELTQTSSDLYLEGHDQYRGWFMSSLVLAAAAGYASPYRSVVSHGFTVDAEGKKMSKSSGNVIDPQTIMEKYGADVLRLWVATCDYSSEMVISETILSRVSDIYRRIRNTARYALANLYDFQAEHHYVIPDQMVGIDQWLCNRVIALQAQILEHYELKRFHEVVKLLYEFCAFDLGAFYLDICKDRLYTLPAESAARRSAQSVIWVTLQALNRWIWPLLSFTAQELWDHCHPEGVDSMALSRWFDLSSSSVNDPRLLQSQWETLMQLRKSVLAQLEQSRSAGLIKSPLEAGVHLSMPSETIETCRLLGTELPFFLMVSEVYLREHAAALTVEIYPAHRTRCSRCWLRVCEAKTVTQGVEPVCIRCKGNQSCDPTEWESRIFV